MPIPTKYILVQLVEDVGMVATDGSIENMIPAFEIRGFVQNGNVKKQYGQIQLREEIIGQPEFDGLCGPMYGGPGIVRYEDWNAYERLST